MNIIARMSGDGYGSRLFRMSVLPMAAASPTENPSVLFNCSNDLANLHLINHFTLGQILLLPTGVGKLANYYYHETALKRVTY